MSNPNLSPELKAQIDKYIADETARILAAQNPPAPRELTPAEQATAHLNLLDRLERSDKSTVSGSGPTHERIAMILRLLVAKVFPPEQASEQASDATATAVVAPVVAPVNDSVNDVEIDPGASGATGE